jgi:hydroxymethylglutaryl-CoA reductase (NADPH)
MFFPIMVLWSMCLAYFFGFFGISFLDTEELSESPSTFGLADLKRQADAAEAAESARALQKPVKPQAVKNTSTSAATHQPRHDGPICSDKPTTTVVKESADIDAVDFSQLSDDEVFDYLMSGSLKDYQLEKRLGDYERAVVLRRRLYENLLDKKLDLIPYAGYDYNKVFGANCEIVIGYVPLPVGVVGPIVMNGEPIYVPMATTEGCLVASTNRGCKAM